MDEVEVEVVEDDPAEEVSTGSVIYEKTFGLLLITMGGLLIWWTLR